MKTNTTYTPENVISLIKPGLVFRSGPGCPANEVVSVNTEKGTAQIRTTGCKTPIEWTLAEVATSVSAYKELGEFEVIGRMMADGKIEISHGRRTSNMRSVLELTKTQARMMALAILEQIGE